MNNVFPFRDAALGKLSILRHVPHLPKAKELESNEILEHVLPRATHLPLFEETGFFTRGPVAKRATALDIQSTPSGREQTRQQERCNNERRLRG